MPQGLGVQLGLGAGRSATSSGAAGGAFPNAYSVEFDGANDYMDTGYVVGTTSALTLSAWAKEGYGIGPELIMGDIDAGGSFANTRIWFGFYNKTIYTVMGDGSDYWYARGADTYDATSTFFDDGWHHLALVIDGSSQKFYIDSTLRFTADTTDTGSATGSSGSGASLGTAQTSGQEIPVGISGVWTGGGFTGFIDEPAIFESALSGASIAAIYNGGIPNAISDSVAWWRMGDGDSPTAGTSDPTGVTNLGSGSTTYAGTLTNGPLYREDVPS